MPEYSGFSRKKLVLEAAGPIPPAPFVELGVTTPFSFLRGASDAIELVMRAHELGMDAIGVTDRNTLAGVVQIHSAAKGAGMRPLIGCRLDLTDAPSLLAYPIDREGYGRLSRLLSLGKMRSDKGECDLSLADVPSQAESIAFIAMPGEDLDAFADALPQLSVAPELQALIDRAMAKKQTERYPNGRAMLEALERIPQPALTPKPAPDLRPTMPSERAVAQKRSRNVLPFVIAAVLVLAAVAYALLR